MNFGIFKKHPKKTLTLAAMILSVFGYSQRSITNINEVREPLQLVTVCARMELKEPLGFIVVDGNRTIEEQLINIRNGRSWTKRSRHLEGAAIDFAATLNGNVMWDLQYYGPFVAAFKDCSQRHNIPIIAGYDWKVKDAGHIELDKRYYP